MIDTMKYAIEIQTDRQGSFKSGDYASLIDARKDTLKWIPYATADRCDATAEIRMYSNDGLETVEEVFYDTDRKRFISNDIGSSVRYLVSPSGQRYTDTKAVI